MKDTFLINKTYKVKVHNSMPIITINSLTQQTHKYTSIKEVTNIFNVSDSTIRYYILNNKKYQDTYFVKL